jgi:hypothetical protein
MLEPVSRCNVVIDAYSLAFLNNPTSPAPVDKMEEAKATKRREVLQLELWQSVKEGGGL